MGVHSTHAAVTILAAPCGVSKKITTILLQIFHHGSRIIMQKQELFIPFHTDVVLPLVWWPTDCPFYRAETSKENPMPRGAKIPVRFFSKRNQNGVIFQTVAERHNQAHYKAIFSEKDS